MENTDILSIKWKDFPEKISSTLGSLRENQDFTDVTLACQDGLQVEAHKVVLAASSPFFNDLLRQNDKNYALIYMRGVMSIDVVNMIDFLYYGKVSVEQSHLEQFLAMAKELRLEGLTDSDDDRCSGGISTVFEEVNIETDTTELILAKPLAREKIEEIKSPIKSEKVEDSKSGAKCSEKMQHDIIQGPEEKKVEKMGPVVKNESLNKLENLISKTLENIEDEKTKSLEEKKSPSEIQKEANTFACDLCEKKYKTYNHLNTHKNSKHEEKKFMCDECEYQSAWHSHFLRHKQSKHGLNQPRNGRMNYCEWLSRC